MSGHSSSNPIWQGLCSKTLRWVWRPNVAGRVLRMELAGSALGHFGTAGGKTNPAMPWNIFLHGTLNRWVIRGKGLCTDMFFFDITIVISGYEWNLSFETWKGFKSHHGLTISPCFFLKFCWVCCGRCKCAMEMPFCGPALAWAKLTRADDPGQNFGCSHAQTSSFDDSKLCQYRGFHLLFGGCMEKMLLVIPPTKPAKLIHPPPQPLRLVGE